MSFSNLEDLIKNNSRDFLKDKDIDSDDFDSQLQRFKNDRYKEDTKSRKYLAYWAAGVVSIYLLFVMFILIFNYALLLCLSDTVLITLLGTTTINVLGLMYIVLKGYFSK